MARPSKLPPHEELLQIKVREGLTNRALGERYGVGEKAVSMAFARGGGEKQIRASESQTAFPWTIDPRHANGTLYRSILAFRHWQGKTKQLSPKEYEQAMRVKETAEQLGAAITYDRDNGFAWARRRPEDGDAMFVVR